MTVIKICGIRTLSDALAASDVGADYVGFNFYAKSPRFIELEECAKITAVLKTEAPKLKLVGVFVNTPVHDIQRILQTCMLDLAQLHGDETPQMVAQLAPYAFKAFRGVCDGMDEYQRIDPPSYLLDASVTGAYGGTGIISDWNRAAELAQRRAFFLAGGLNPDNVADAVRRVHPWGVDVASGVESVPGVKDQGKMKEFVQAVLSNDESSLHPNSEKRRNDDNHIITS
jgi:phosphoribosylanthranilate isomerase